MIGCQITSPVLASSIVINQEIFIPSTGEVERPPSSTAGGYDASVYGAEEAQLPVYEK